MKKINSIKQKSHSQTDRLKNKKGPVPMTWPENVQAFLSKVDIKSPTECWPWLGATEPMGTGSSDDYGIVVAFGRRISVHRFAYQITKGLIPDWLVVAHRCDNGLCGNPSHLHLVTQKENMREAKLRGRFPVGEKSSSAALDAIRVFLLRDLYYSALLDTTSLEKLFKIKNIQPIIRGEHWPQEPMPQSFETCDHKKLHRINNGLAQCSISFETLCLAHELRKKGMLTKEIGGIVGLSPSRVTVILRPGTTAYAATNTCQQKQIFQASERIQSWMWQNFVQGTLDQNLIIRICKALVVRFGNNFLGYPDTDDEIINVLKKNYTPTNRSIQQTIPRLNILKMNWGNEPFSRTFSAPVTAGVIIRSGQVISLVSGAWVLGCAAGLEPYIAFADSADTDVVSSGTLLGLSCAGQFEIETAYFDNTQTYVNSSPLIAGTSASTPTSTTTQSAVQAGAYKGNLTLGTLATAEDTLGFCTGGGRQNTSAIATNGGPTNSQATAFSSTGAVLPLYLLRFMTHWLPKATTSS